jgi:hypothetical protein
MHQHDSEEDISGTAILGNDLDPPLWGGLDQWLPEWQGDAQ